MEDKGRRKRRGRRRKRLIMKKREKKRGIKRRCQRERKEKGEGWGQERTGILPFFEHGCFKW